MKQCWASVTDDGERWRDYLCLDENNHSLIHSFMHLFIHSFIYLFSHSCIHSFVHSFIRSVIYLLIRLVIYSFNQSINHSFTQGFIHSSIHIFISTSIHSSSPICLCGAVLILHSCEIKTCEDENLWKKLTFYFDILIWRFKIQIAL